MLVVGTVIVISVLQLRRHTSIFGSAELGGPRFTKILTMLALWSVWIAYITMSVLQAYCIVSGF